MSKKAREVRGMRNWLKVSSREPEYPAKVSPAPEPSRFEVGRDYEIISTESRPNKQDIISPTTGMNCVFRYEGKEGIHHCFREIRGGWTRTYTDTQLIGKRISEVK